MIKDTLWRCPYTSYFAAILRPFEYRYRTTPSRNRERGSKRTLHHHYLCIRFITSKDDAIQIQQVLSNLQGLKKYNPPFRQLVISLSVNFIVLLKLSRKKTLFFISFFFSHLGLNSLFLIMMSSYFLITCLCEIVKRILEEIQKKIWKITQEMIVINTLFFDETISD